MENTQNLAKQSHMKQAQKGADAEKAQAFFLIYVC